MINKFSELIKNKILCEIRNYQSNYNERLFNQKRIYIENNLNRDLGIKKLNDVLKDLNLVQYSEDYGMYSEHLIIFAAISKKYREIKSILEIGTFDGITSTIIAKLFPNANILTLDLEDNDLQFKNSYNRDDPEKRKLFIKDRNKRLSKFNNIEFKQINSLYLTIDYPRTKKFDLIWIDGAHGYPVVCSDITNAISLSGDNTIIMCDDIWKELKKNDKIYSSVAAWETLEAFSESNILLNNYFCKRIGKKFLATQKFISFSKLKKSKNAINS